MAKAKRKNVVRVAMMTGRLTLRSGRHEWINPTTKIKHEGVSLEMDDRDSGGTGYATLNLDTPEDREKLKLLEELMEGGDTRIRQYGIQVLKDAMVAPPFPWWKNTTAKVLIEQVKAGVDAIEGAAAKEAFLQQCVDYELQQENPRDTLVKQIEKIDTKKPVVDPLAVPAE